MEFKQIGSAVLEKGTIILHGADPATKDGFVQVPKFVLKHPQLTFGAKVTYSSMLGFAWQVDYAFPGQKKLAEDLGVGERQVRNFINELKKEKLLRVQRRGLGKTNIYHLYLRVVDKMVKSAR